MLINNGLGASNMPASSLISSGIATAGGAVAAAASTGALVAIGIGAQAVPIIGTIVGGIALAVAALGIGNGCGPTCTASTEVVNKIEPYMKQNVQAAQQQAASNGGCLTPDEVATLTTNFNQLWNYVTQNCQQVGGPGGRQCIQDRQRGGKWDWFGYYLDPINAYPVCSPSPVSSISSLVSGGGISLGSNWPLWVGAGLLGLLVLGGDK